VTIIGIPVGLQCFKLAQLSFAPFGREVIYNGGAPSFIINVIWFILSGLVLALGNFLMGCLLCVTIIGIPFGKQFFKIAKLALALCDGTFGYTTGQSFILDGGMHIRKL
jgi:uncharacterized membrane protein YccF (DUF307 family)